MIWLTWRQFRVQAGVVFAALAVLGVALAVTGPAMADEYADGMKACTAQGDCGPFTGQFIEDHTSLFVAFSIIVLLLPAIIGMFWGAPLVAREFEAGTHRLVWNQSVPRTRWLVVKISLVGLAAMVAAGLASLAVGWWASPFDQALAVRIPRFAPELFDARGIVPVGFAAFAFALGLTVGILVRRTVPAVAVTLALFAVVQVAVPLAVRPHLAEPARVTTAITADNISGLMIGSGGRMSVMVDLSQPGGWILSNETVDAAGKVVGAMPESVSAKCTPDGSQTGGIRMRDECYTNISQLGYRQQVIYHPAGRYWAFQWAETAIFLVLALGLAAFSFWWIRRRPA
ncbi:ABC transporter permease subunit [Longispora sp. NPDC051575]|uniref:ABC transporter permease subunit n=1 Tax=Longispora sp. NPDC051575 TaxID=3154943 RepID=UPI0034267105